MQTIRRWHGPRGVCFDVHTISRHSKVIQRESSGDLVIASDNRPNATNRSLGHAAIPSPQVAVCSIGIKAYALSKGRRVEADQVLGDAGRQKLKLQIERAIGLVVPA